MGTDVSTKRTGVALLSASASAILGWRHLASAFDLLVLDNLHQEPQYSQPFDSVLIRRLYPGRQTTSRFAGPNVDISWSGLVLGQTPAGGHRRLFPAKNRQKDGSPYRSMHSQGRLPGGRMGIIPHPTSLGLAAHVPRVDRTLSTRCGPYQGSR